VSSTNESTPESRNHGELKKALVVTLSTAAFLVASVGVYRAIHSPLFLVQVVEVTTQNADQISVGQAEAIPTTQGDATAQPWTPVDADKISDLASIPVGEVNLFDLDLKSVEKRILRNEWIREVKLQKRFPQTLSITAVFREPKAILTEENGTLSYVDSDGKAFGRVNLLSQSDLPMFHGFESENQAELASALQLVSEWEKSSLGPLCHIQSLSLDPERGYRVMVSYPISTPTGMRLFRARIDLGREKEVLSEGKLFPEQIQRLTQVFEYLRHNSIAARQIFADAGKKIVVKTARGS
jgi:hypothetical protein